MALIDELILRLSLDTKTFDAQQKAAVNTLRSFEKESVKAASGAEAGAKKLTDALNGTVREVLALGAAFMGVSGLKDLVVSTTQAAAGLGIMSNAFNINAEAVNRWQGAMRHFQVSSQATANAIAQLQIKLQQFKTGQVLPGDLGFQALNALGIGNQNLDPARWENFLLEVSSALRKHPEVAAGLGQGIPSIPTLLPGLMDPNLGHLLATSQTLWQGEIDAATRVNKAFVEAALKVEEVINRMLLTDKNARDAVGFFEGVQGLASGDSTKMREWWWHVENQGNATMVGLTNWLTSQFGAAWNVPEQSIARHQGVRPGASSMPVPAPWLPDETEPSHAHPFAKAMRWNKSAMVYHPGRFLPGNPFGGEPQWVAPYLGLGGAPWSPSAVPWASRGDTNHTDNSQRSVTVNVTPPPGVRDPRTFGGLIAAEMAQQGAI